MRTSEVCAMPATRSATAASLVLTACACPSCGSGDGAMEDADAGGDAACAPLVVGAEVYRFCDALYTWDDARALCQQQGLDLVVLESEQEQSAVVAAIARGEPFEVWIGLTAEDCDWRWVDGSAPSFLGFEGGVGPSPPCECVVLTERDRWEPRACRLADEALVLCE